MSEQTIHQLCNAYFRIRESGGFLTSIRPGAAVSGEETEYVDPEHSFGQLRIHGVRERADFDIRLCPEEGSLTVQRSFSPRGTVYEAVSEQEGLRIVQSYLLRERTMTYTIRVRNVGRESVLLEDLSLPFPCNTRFNWGESAADKVIGHHFIAGHGSHLVFERCDGKGPILLVLPQGKTSLEYYYTDAETEPKRRGGSCVCIHSGHIRREAVKAGARPHVEESVMELAPDGEMEYSFLYTWAADLREARERFVEHGLIDVEVLPGMTAVENRDVHLSLRSSWETLTPVLPEGAEIVSEQKKGDRLNLVLRFHVRGEKRVRIEYANGRFMNLTFFITQPLETMIRKRGRFIAGHQHRDPSKWYYGLLAEWNNETGALLGPDNYDGIKGWRIYEVTCDDPGLSKPAFLSSKLALYPDPEEIRALDLYVEHFVWGGLQCTEEEPFPYAIYGIPDWKKNRDSEDPGLRGRLHIWRAYDYPHIFLMYYNLYRIARKDPDAGLTHDAVTYLLRAYRTAIAQYTVPAELDGWSAYGTGFYNEMIIEEILDALQKEGLCAEHDRLERLWKRKVSTFVLENADVFGSEYPFDTTGFESTHVLAKRALKSAQYEEGGDYFNHPITAEKAWQFMESQIRCNIACRGVLEPAYYWYGSDYRSSNFRYTLSYMSQMGGMSVLDYGLYYAADPFPFLRLGYGSLMSSWALLNSGEADSDYGYFFPGKQNDGAASGGFEPQYLGQTWLEQPHHGGPWYYSCEIDLGFCGYLRGARTVLAEDPIFGRVCLGGVVTEKDGVFKITPEDGVGRRVHYITKEDRVHITLSEGRISHVYLDPNGGTVCCRIDLSQMKAGTAALTVTNDKTTKTVTLGPGRKEETVSVTL